MEFDHELRLWLKSKKSRKTHLDTRVEAAQSDTVFFLIKAATQTKSQ